MSGGPAAEQARTADDGAPRPLLASSHQPPLRPPLSSPSATVDHPLRAWLAHRSPPPHDRRAALPPRPPGGFARTKPYNRAAGSASASAKTCVKSSSPSVKVAAAVAPSSSSASRSSTPAKQAQVKVAVHSSTAAPKPTSTSVAPAPPASTKAAAAPVSVGGHKLGLGWDYRNPNTLSDWASTDALVYTWSEYPPSGGVPGGMTWLPMFTCTDKADSFGSQVGSGAIAPGSTILGFNEPDQPGQCPMSAQDAAGSYKALITEPYGANHKLVSPAPTNSPAGRQWLSDFMGACGDCGIQAMAVHFYGTDAYVLPDGRAV